jgi:hypothetical protein
MTCFWIGGQHVTMVVVFFQARTFAFFDTSWKNDFFWYSLYVILRLCNFGNFQIFVAQNQESGILFVLIYSDADDMS